MRDNIILLTDSYKVSHWKQYPPRTSQVFSFFESRGGEFPTTTFFGLSYIIQKHLAGVRVTRAGIEQAARRFKKHFGDEAHFNREGWEHILTKWGGCLPLLIRAVPEGTTVPTGNVLMTIENIDPDVPWLVNYVETLLTQVWYPTTVCTQSREMKRLIKTAMETTGADMAGLPFKLHDFGYRGSTSVESAGIGGLAHLVNFLGTDTLAALDVAEEYYDEENAGFSIPAAEHSTITSWGRNREIDAYRNMLQSYPTGLVAVVSDSYDIYNSVANIWGGSLRNEVLSRDGTVVIRPDSGDPPTVINRLLNLLDVNFGSTVNAKGFTVINPKVRLIQGDGIDLEMLKRILDMMIHNYWSIDNIAFGSGGGLLQKVNRDTSKFATKCSSVTVDGQSLDVYKTPIDAEWKHSKRGRVILCKNEEGEYYTGIEGDGHNYLETVFLGGVDNKRYTLAEIRERAAL